MKFVAKSAMFVVASAFVAASPAMAQPLSPAPVAGIGLLGFAAVLYAARVVRRMR